MRNRLSLLAALSVASLVSAVNGQQMAVAPAIVPAEAGSWQGIAGQTILGYVGGRTLEEAGGAAFNPFGIDGDDLLFALGSFFITADYTGEAVHEGEVSILPQFTTPRGGAFEPSETTPAIIPFALIKDGVCYGGFVAGYPVPDQVYSVDMSGQLCHAVTVDEIVHAQYLTVAETQPETAPAETPVAEPAFNPGNPLDAELDLAVWAAYSAAYDIATADTEYRFVRNGDYAPLRQAIAAALEAEGLAAIEVAAVPAVSPEAAFGCAAPGKVELRLALSAGGAGITLVAASPRRMASYAFDPDISDSLEIGGARNCRTSGLGRADTLNEP